MCAIGRLCGGGRGGGLCDGGCVLGDGGQLLLAKRRPGWAGSVFTLPTLVLAVGPLPQPEGEHTRLSLKMLEL